MTGRAIQALVLIHWGSDMSKRKVKHGLRQMRFALVERWYDFINVLWPIFMVSGLLVACFKFWLWVLT